jgi:hypothetical protein
VRRGATLSARVGAWANAPTGYAYRWQRLGRWGWEDVAAGTGASYVTKSADIGRRLRVVVVASNSDGSASAGSPPTAPIGDAGLNRAASSSSKKARRAIRAKTSAKKAKRRCSSRAKRGSAKKAKRSCAKQAKRKRATRTKARTRR